MRIGILSAEDNEEDFISNKRLVKEILLSGNRPVIINYRKTVLAITKKGRVLCQVNKKGTLKAVRVDAVIPRISEASESDEKSINLGTLALQALISNGTYTTATPQGIKLAKSKIRSQIALSAAGVATPRTASITSTDDTFPVDEALKIVEPNPNRRVIIKTTMGSLGRGVMPAATRGEARAIVEGFLANNIAVLVQQFIEPKRSGKYTDVRLIVVDGKVIASMMRSSTKKDEIRANLSLGGEGSPHTPTIQEIEMAEKAAAAVGLPVCGVDIIPSSKGPVVIELNATPGFLIEKVAGVNVVKTIVKMVTSNVHREDLQTSLLKSQVRAQVKQIKKMPAIKPALKTIQTTKNMITEALES